ncbi:MAG: autotransporter outer membrane beta-barrel domain-containing protein [Rhodospirillaceae bacterium]|nr:autotransporter outer membrane beta-barrel domain-containing protein [Rhodospirillaceae bacterium]MYI47993.1 autotransporter outer membrane beta-barrel domain-containing protein [Rhodospirillaceae bacterium]
MTIGDGVAVGTIENSDPLPAAWLSRFGRTVAEQALDGVAGRMAASRTPGMQGTLAGQALIPSTGAGQAFDPTASGQPGAGGTAPGGSGADRDAVLAMADIARSFDRGSGGAGHGGDAFGHGDAFGDDRSGTGFGGTQARSRTMSAREALLGSSFSLTAQRDGAGGTMAFWGRASQGSFDGKERGDGTDIGLDGEVTTGMLGADYARGRWLVGLALTQSTAEGKYAAIGAPAGAPTGADDGAVRAGDGTVEASLTAAIPYAAFRASERLKLWGAAGYGSGEVTLKTVEENYKADTSWTMAAAGMRGDLLVPPADGTGGPALALTSDALWARTSSDDTSELRATESDVTRLRLGLEGSWHVALENGGQLTPKLEVGARHDGGDAETGFGVELGGGVRWTDPALGLSLDLSGRTLLAHEDGAFRDRGYAASLSYDPTPATKRGPTLSMRQAFGGKATGGLDALFDAAPLEDRVSGAGGGEATSRWTMEAAWGFPVFGDRFTGSPHVGLGLAAAARDYSLGWRLTPESRSAPDLSFGLKATRRESDTAGPEHAIGLELTTRW